MKTTETQHYQRSTHLKNQVMFCEVVWWHFCHSPGETCVTSVSWSNNIYSASTSVIELCIAESLLKSVILSHYIDCYCISECTWTEHQFELATWAFRKWRYHQFTSLRVCIPRLTFSQHYNIICLHLLLWSFYDHSAM